MSQLNAGPARDRPRVIIITLFGVLLTGLALVTMLGSRATSGATSSDKWNSPDGSCWVAGYSPNKGISGNYLNAIALVPTGGLWTVGFSDQDINGFGITKTLVEYWDGAAWNVVPSPNPGNLDNELRGVTVVASNDVWAVGSYSGGGVTNALVEHWNGTEWSIVPSPNPGTTSNYLFAVAAVSATDVWAVGYYSYPYRTLVEHWDGTAWSVVASPSPGAGHNELRGVAAVSANDVWAVGIYYDYNSPQRTLVEHWDGSTWRVVPSTNPGAVDNNLNAVTAVAANDVWAVGSYGDPAQPLIEHWNGAAWGVVASPNPSGSDGSHLNAVAFASASDVWTVGEYSDAAVGTTQTLVERWNGSAWSLVATPNPSAIDNEFRGIAVASASDVWAAGVLDHARIEAETGQPLVEHWNGTAWSVVSSPRLSTAYNELRSIAVEWAGHFWVVGYFENVSTGAVETLAAYKGLDWSITQSRNPSSSRNVLNSVSLVSDDVWAVGYYDAENTGVHKTLVERQHGSAWSIVPSPIQGDSHNILNAVTAVAANDVWAVGSYLDEGTGSYKTLVEHWDGTQWSIVPSPNQGNSHNVLNALVAVSASDLWVVGQFYDGGTSFRTLVEHWNGSTWSIVPSPNQNSEDNILNSVTAVSAGDLWAVGTYGNPRRTLIEHWNGTGWTVVPSPNPGSNGNELLGVAAKAADNAWAVGDYYDADGKQLTLVEHWNGSGWRVFSSASPGVSHNVLNAISDGIAVGSYDRSGAQRTLIEMGPGDCPPTPTPTPTPIPTPCTAGHFSDVPPGSTFYPYVTCLANQGIISGYADCSFRPNNPVTRGQLAKIVSNSAGFSDPQTTQLFQDVAVGSAFFQYIGRLASRGYMNGYPCGGVGEPCGGGNLPYFRPNNKASRGQLTKIVSNAAGFEDSIPTSVQTFTDVPPNSTFWLYVERLLLNRPGVMGGYPCGGANEPCDPQQRPYFRPGNNVTRGQTSKIVANTFFPGCETLATRK